MNDFKATIVVPTCRQENLTTFLEAWKDQFAGHRVIVVVDGEANLDRKDCEIYDHHSLKELGDDFWIISTGSSAIRNFGTLKALEQPCDFIWHLDDDCLPSDGTELQRHYDNLFKGFYENKWISTDAKDQMVRGIPYLNQNHKANVVVSHGTWLKNPDYDAAHQLAHRFEFEPADGLIPVGRYFPMCGMNLAFKPEVAMAMYFAPKGERYNRNDDIWMGIVAKKVFDRLDLHCYTGYPQVIHERASDPFKNLIAEGPFIEANENFWDYVDQLTITGQSVEECMAQVAAQMVLTPYWNEGYFRDYGRALKAWITLTKRREAGDTHEQLRQSSSQHQAQKHAGKKG
jgi:hypothetical protein